MGFSNWGTLTSPVIDLSSVLNPTLRFKHFLKTENVQPDTAYYDIASVEVSSDGITWNQLMVRGSTNGNWLQETAGLSNFRGGSVKVRFKFDTRDSLYNDYEGWFVDDVQIIGQDAPPTKYRLPIPEVLIRRSRKPWTFSPRMKRSRRSVF